MLPAVQSKAAPSPFRNSSPPAIIGRAAGGRDHSAPPRGPIWHALLAPIGLLAVLLSCVCLSSKTPFPGAAALPAVAGTALLIRYGRRGWVSNLLSWRPLVAIGKMSYSLYLWHWPVTVFWRYVAYNQVGTADYAGMLFLSLLLGWLSWRFVETPVRTSQAWTMRRTFLFAGAGMASLVVLGTTCVLCAGWPKLLHPAANEVADKAPPRNAVLVDNATAAIRRIGAVVGWDFPGITEHRQFYERHGGGGPRIGAGGEPEVFLLGDSHAGSLRPGLDAVLRGRGIAGYFVSRSSTDLFDETLPASQDAMRKLSGLPSVKQVVLAEMWRRVAECDEQDPVARAEILN